MIFAKINYQEFTNALMCKIGFILFVACFTSTILLFYSNLLIPLIPPSHLLREYFICFGQIIFQGVLLFFIKAKKELILEYIVNMMMVSLLGALFLLPAFIGYFFNIKFPFGYLIYFFLVVSFMFFNHKKRIKKLYAPAWLTYTWVLYRCLILLILF